MPVPAADPRPRRTPTALAGLAGLACAACCLLPVLIAAGLVGAGASVLVSWLPALAFALAALAAGVWWVGRRRALSCTCPSPGAQDGCGCKETATPLEITGQARR